MMIRRLYLLVLAAGLMAGCSESSTDATGQTETENLVTRSFYAGVSGLVPRNYPDPLPSDWTELFDSLPDYGEFHGSHVVWDGEDENGNKIPDVIEIAYDVLEGEPMTPYIAIGFEPDRLTQDEADHYFQEHREEFIEVCRQIASTFRPDIFLIGIEINRYYEKSPAGFEDFIDVYREIYAEVKDLSPGTTVGSNFQLDYMRGAGARSGVQRDPHWELLDLFEPQIDITTFTLYPFFDVDHPAEIESNYLTEITQHTSRPLMITETGWPSRTVPNTDISVGEEVQVEYLNRLLELAEPVPLEVLIWAFPHDPETGQAGGLFDHISMKNNDGTAKAVFSDWQELLERPVE